MSSQVVEKLETLARPVLEELGLELWDIEYKTAGRRALVRLSIDRPGEESVTVDQCQQVSRELGVILDVEDPIHAAYDLEVSSPGLDRRLRHGWHFQASKGERVEVTLFQPLDGRRHLTGVLATEDGETLRLETEEGVVEIRREQISKAQVVPDYDRLMGNVADR